MDAHALLTSQGWRGTGHSLHPTSDKTGLSRPLLVSRKDNTLGVGKKQHRTSDMWWMNAFDSSLKSLDTSKEGQVVQTNTSGSLDMVKKGGGKFVGTDAGKGLYACFVRGECLTGTIEEKKVETSSESAESEGSEESERPKKRRKRERAADETKEERRARKLARRAARAEKAAAKLERQKKKAQKISKSEDEDDESSTKTETKEERKERRRLKKLAKEAEKNYINLSSEKAKKKKRRKDS